MDRGDIGTTIFAVTMLVAGVAGLCLLAAGAIFGLSRRLAGFRLPFMSAFKAVAASMVVSLLLRGVGGMIDRAVGFGIGWALAFAGVIYFLAWYLDRYVSRPDGTPLGRGDGYRLALVYAVFMLVLSLVAGAFVDTSHLN